MEQHSERTTDVSIVYLTVRIALGVFVYSKLLCVTFSEVYNTRSFLPQISIALGMNFSNSICALISHVILAPGWALNHLNKLDLKQEIGPKVGVDALSQNYSNSLK